MGGAALLLPPLSPLPGAVTDWVEEREPLAISSRACAPNVHLPEGLWQLFVGEPQDYFLPLQLGWQQSCDEAGGASADLIIGTK